MRKILLIFIVLCIFMGNAVANNDNGAEIFHNAVLDKCNEIEFVDSVVIDMTIKHDLTEELSNFCYSQILENVNTYKLSKTGLSFDTQELFEDIEDKMSRYIIGNMQTFSSSENDNFKVYATYVGQGYTGHAFYILHDLELDEISLFNNNVVPSDPRLFSDSTVHGNLLFTLLNTEMYKCDMWKNECSVIFKAQTNQRLRLPIPTHGTLERYMKIKGDVLTFSLITEIQDSTLYPDLPYLNQEENTLVGADFGEMDTNKQDHTLRYYLYDEDYKKVYKTYLVEYTSLDISDF